MTRPPGAEVWSLNYSRLEICFCDLFIIPDLESEQRWYWVSAQQELEKKELNVIDIQLTLLKY